MSKEKKSDGRLSLNTMQMIALGFLGVILLGGVLLWLPFSNQEPIAFADALFTSCLLYTSSRFRFVSRSVVSNM